MICLLRDSCTVRARCQLLLERLKRGESGHFGFRIGNLQKVVDLVVAETRANYPDLKVPFHSRWRHFEVGGVDRIFELRESTLDLDTREWARCLVDLVVVSVFLDAGAGADWKYLAMDGCEYGRSEGLALASFEAFRHGTFSSDSAHPVQADAQCLTSITELDLAKAFQVRTDNPLVGLAGRAKLLSALGRALLSSEVFPQQSPRIGHLFDYLVGQCDANHCLSAGSILRAVLDAFSSIWPSRITLEGENLGDVWEHSAINPEDPVDHFVPLHKLSQWLSYSLIEPLEMGGITVTNIEDLTGLAEYRNGGLLIDAEVLIPLDEQALHQVHEPHSEFIVEWRALTVSLLDVIADRVRAELGKSCVELPLASILQGGTWSAGRKLAYEKRADGSSPIAVASDGTLF